MDVVAHEDYIEVFIECAGVKKEDIKLELDSGILTISGEKTSSYETARTAERKFGKFSRKLKVPYGIEKDEITAKCEDGVLCIQLRKKEIPVEDKTISIE
jgi:HSP20 family protein